MFRIQTAEFEKMVTDSLKSIPSPYQDNLKNIAFFVEDYPSIEQVNKLKLRPCDRLFGLYEGVPLPDRRGGYTLTLPDRMTVFKVAHEENAVDIKDMRQQVYNTVWHEVAHYYGLNHEQIAKLQSAG